MIQWSYHLDTIWVALVFRISTGSMCLEHGCLDRYRFMAGGYFRKWADYVHGNTIRRAAGSKAFQMSPIHLLGSFHAPSSVNSSQVFLTSFSMCNQYNSRRTVSNVLVLPTAELGTGHRHLCTYHSWISLGPSPCISASIRVAWTKFPWRFYALSNSSSNYWRQ